MLVLLDWLVFIFTVFNRSFCLSIHSLTGSNATCLLIFITGIWKKIFLELFHLKIKNKSKFGLLVTFTLTEICMDTYYPAYFWNAYGLENTRTLKYWFELELFYFHFFFFLYYMKMNSPSKETATILQNELVYYY